MAEEQHTNKKKYRERIHNPEIKKELVNLIRNECGDDVAEAFAKTAGCSVESGMFVRTSTKDVLNEYRPLLLENEEAITRLANSLGIKDVSYFKNQNIVKTTCNELGMTYKELGEAIGYSEGALKTAVSTNKISKSMIKAIELYKKTLELEKELENSNKIKSTLKEWLK